MKLARLLQLASPALPVGGYSYSGGLESSIEAGVVKDATGAAHWIGDVLAFSIGRLDAPMLLRMMRSAEPWNAQFLAGRETAELRAETVQMGYSLNRLLPELGVPALEIEEPTFPAVYAHAAAAWGIAPREALVAYLWSWAENQVMAALKAVPLGQTDGQKILLAIGERLEQVADEAQAMADEDIGSFVPALAILSSRHETQYSRLFRS
ncbi:MAG: urease accessory protein UreF [Betaproteobacteria bacterium]|nr:urease accessory protein UreF [Betaproteobacteria bacterium]